MSVLATLLELEDLGVRISVADERIHLVDPNSVLTPDLLERVRQQKREILALLKSDAHESSHQRWAQVARDVPAAPMFVR